MLLLFMRVRRSLSLSGITEERFVDVVGLVDIFIGMSWNEKERDVNVAFCYKN